MNKTSNYINVVIQNGTFDITEGLQAKPSGESAITCLNKIQEITEGNLVYTGFNPILHGSNRNKYLSNKALEIKTNYDNKVASLNCIQKLFHKAPSEGTYYDIVIENDHFHIVKRTYKPEDSGFALKALANIATAIERLQKGQLKYTAGYQDEYADLASKGLVDTLKKISTTIISDYNKKIDNLNFIENVLVNRDAMPIAEARMANLLTQPLVFPALEQILMRSSSTDLSKQDQENSSLSVLEERPRPSFLNFFTQNLILPLLTISELATFSLLNRDGLSHQRQALAVRAKQFGFEGEDTGQAFEFISSLFISTTKFLSEFIGWGINIFSEEKTYLTKLKAVCYSTDKVLETVRNFSAEEFFDLACDSKFPEIDETLFYNSKFPETDLNRAPFYKFFKPNKNALQTPLLDANLQEKAQHALHNILYLPKDARDSLIEFILQLGANPQRFINQYYFFFHRPELISAFQLFFQYGADVNTVVHNQSILYYFCRENMTEIVSFLLKNGADPNFAAFGRLTPLTTATFNNKLEIAQELINFNVNITHQDLSFALYNGRLAIAQLLLSKLNVNEVFIQFIRVRFEIEYFEFLLNNGANINYKNKEGLPLLAFAIKNENILAVELLLKLKVNVNEIFVFKDMECAYLYITENITIQKMLLDGGANPNLIVNDSYSLLADAKFKNKEDHVKLLLAYGAEEDYYYQLFSSSLYEPLKEKDHDKIKSVLIENPHLKSFLLAPIYLFPDSNPKELVSLFLEAGADPNEFTDDLAPLHLLADDGKLEIASLMIDSGADPNIKGPKDFSPLIFACLSSNDTPEMIRLLLDKGADPNQANARLSAPLHFAAQSGKLESTTILLDGGALINEKGLQGGTPLAFACGYCTNIVGKTFRPNPEMVKLLLERGADPTIATDDGSTPLQLAEKRGLTEIVDLLKGHQGIV